MQHIAEHGVSVEEVEEVLLDDRNEVFTSRSSGYPIVFGYTSTGRYLAVVFEHMAENPLTLPPDHGRRCTRKKQAEVDKWLVRLVRESKSNGKLPNKEPSANGSSVSVPVRVIWRARTSTRPLAA